MNKEAWNLISRAEMCLDNARTGCMSARQREFIEIVRTSLAAFLFDNPPDPEAVDDDEV